MLKGNVGAFCFHKYHPSLDPLCPSKRPDVWGCLTCRDTLSFNVVLWFGGYFVHQTCHQLPVNCCASALHTSELRSRTCIAQPNGVT